MAKNILEQIDCFLVVEFEFSFSYTKEVNVFSSAAKDQLLLDT